MGHSVIRRSPRRALWVAIACACIFQLQSRLPSLLAWTATTRLGKKSTAKEVVDKLAADRQLNGRVAIVTGGNSGIGVETAKALAYAGCRVVLASRSVEAGQRALENEIRKEGIGGYAVPDADVVVKPLDLANLSSVAAFAQDVCASESRIDYVVLNAGIMALPNLERTADGFEKQIGVNHFGHAFLTRLLLPALEAQADPSRIVSLASTAHNMARDFDVADLHFTESRSSKYSPWGAYGNSKLSNILFTKALSRRLPSDGKISAVSVHPGVIRTNLWQSTAASDGIVAWLLNIFVVDKSVPQGAATTVWACVAEDVRKPQYEGAYLADCALGSLSTTAQDDALAEDLWQETESQLNEALAFSLAVPACGAGAFDKYNLSLAVAACPTRAIKTRPRLIC